MTDMRVSDSLIDRVLVEREAPHPALRATLSRRVQPIDIVDRCLRTEWTGGKVKSSSREKAIEVIAMTFAFGAGGMRRLALLEGSGVALDRG